MLLLHCYVYDGMTEEAPFFIIIFIICCGCLWVVQVFEENTFVQQINLQSTWLQFTKDSLAVNRSKQWAKITTQWIPKGKKR